MRVALVTNAFPRYEGDYYGIAVWELASFLRERGHTVHVVTSRREGSSPMGSLHGIPVHRFEYFGWHADRRPGELASKPWRLVSQVLQGTRCLTRVVRDEHFDLIHAYWLLPSGLIGLLSALIAGTPVVASSPGTDLTLLPQHPVSRAILRVVTPRLDALIVLGTPLRQTALELGVRPERAHLVLGDGGIDGELFKPAPIPPRDRIVLFVARLTPPKRLDTVLLAMAEVIRSCPGVRLRIVGDGPDRPRLQALSSSLGLAGVVVFVGALPHDLVSEEMRRASALVLCTDSEGLPNVVMEAMMSGLPVVATGVGGIPDLIKDGETGYIVSPDDSGSVAERLVHIMTDVGLRQAMSTRARRFAEAHLDKRVIVPQLENIYAAACASHPAHGD